ncbi:hypothetical protein B0H16DRAFT_1460442 [Mycena metata]|uniref:Uncharacterized protein n=1 Tax=Mycena metata TaxID=1033252 RepID=A0AAD7IV44_9AGAR|nr:hypothetical protein B0H16DRAFT_1460442 [Mycena metata]
MVLTFEDYVLAFLSPDVNWDFRFSAEDTLRFRAATGLRQLYIQQCSSHPEMWARYRRDTTRQMFIATSFEPTFLLTLDHNLLFGSNSLRNIPSAPLSLITILPGPINEPIFLSLDHYELLFLNNNKLAPQLPIASRPRWNFR